MTAALAQAPMPSLRVAVRAADPLRQRSLAGTVVSSGHMVSDRDPDVVLADTAASARGEHGAPVLVLGDPPDEATSALPAWVSAPQLDAALRAVAQGLLVRLPSAGGFRAAEPTRALLTPRELSILNCLSEGLSNKEAARRLGISAHTVKFHLESVFAKLGATSRADAVARGLRGGMIEL